MNSDLHGDLCRGRVLDVEHDARVEVGVEGALPDRSDGFRAPALYNAVRISTWGGGAIEPLYSERGTN